MLAPSGDGDVFRDLQQQAILFVNSVVRDPGYRGKTAAGATLTPAARKQVLQSFIDLHQGSGQTLSCVTRGHHVLPLHLHAVLPYTASAADDWRA